METMFKRISLAILLAIQALGGGAVSLAHARDAVVAPPGYEASHSARCAILHDELRCALCQYASARGRHATPIYSRRRRNGRAVHARARVVSFAAAVPLTSPARAPPLPLS